MKHRVKYVDITSQWGIGIITEIIDDIWIADIIFCGELFEDINIHILNREQADLNFVRDDVFIYDVWKKDVPPPEIMHEDHFILCVHSVRHLSDDIVDFLKNVDFLQRI